MKSKQVLDVQQMQHLQELGLELKETMLTWQLRTDGKYSLIPTVASKREVISIPAYTLQDVLDALPKNVSSNGKSYYLNVDLCVGYVCYDRRREDDLLVGVSFAKTGCFINAAYSLLCWAIENKFVETNKNE